MNRKLVLFVMMGMAILSLLGCTPGQSATTEMKATEPPESSTTQMEKTGAVALTEEPSAPTVSEAPPVNVTLTAGSTQVSATDGMVQVYVPAGSFKMGSTDSIANDNEKPQHSVELAAFWMDKFEVTNEKYQKCVSAGACKEPYDKSSATRPSYYGNAEFKNYPVLYVDWDLAKAYCTWAGRRLPTEAEWEKAARGAEGKQYPWGDKISCAEANYKGCKEDTVEVGSLPAGASPYGAMEMTGNVWEWVADWFADDYYAKSPAKDPTGPANGIQRIMRGGSWFFPEYLARATHRGYSAPGLRFHYIGFRCAK